MEKVKLKYKILLILLLPIFTITALSIFIIYDELKIKNNTQKSKSYLEFTKITNDLIKDLQKEREYNLVYILSYGKELKEEIKNQQNSTSKSLRYFDENFLKIKEIFNSKESDIIEKDLKNYLSLIDKKRELISNLSIDYNSVETYYNSLINSLLFFVNKTISYSNNGEISNLLLQYSSIVQSKEEFNKKKNVVNKMILNQILLTKDFEKFLEHFPNIYEKCLSVGIDAKKDLIPVVPACHYFCEE